MSYCADFPEGDPPALMSLWTRVHYTDGRIMRQDRFGIERPYRGYHRLIDALHGWWVNRAWRRQHPGVEVKDADRVIPGE